LAEEEEEEDEDEDDDFFDFTITGVVSAKSTVSV
jgi:hypothetical protein